MEIYFELLIRPFVQYGSHLPTNSFRMRIRSRKPCVAFIRQFTNDNKAT